MNYYRYYRRYLQIVYFPFIGFFGCCGCCSCRCSSSSTLSSSVFLVFPRKVAEWLMSPCVFNDFFRFATKVRIKLREMNNDHWNGRPYTNPRPFLKPTQDFWFEVFDGWSPSSMEGLCCGTFRWKWVLIKRLFPLLELFDLDVVLPAQRTQGDRILLWNNVCDNLPLLSSGERASHHGWFFLQCRKDYIGRELFDMADRPPPQYFQYGLV